MSASIAAMSGGDVAANSELAGVCFSPDGTTIAFVGATSPTSLSVGAPDRSTNSPSFTNVGRHRDARLHTAMSSPAIR